MFESVFAFDGRITRTEYCISVILYFIPVSISNQMGPFGIILFAPSLWFLLAQGTKRSHDIGDDGWFQIALPLYIFWLRFAKGDKAKNKYGYDPMVYGRMKILPSLNTKGYL